MPAISGRRWIREHCGLVHFATLGDLEQCTGQPASAARSGGRWNSGRAMGGRRQGRRGSALQRRCSGTTGPIPAFHARNAPGDRSRRALIDEARRSHPDRVRRSAEDGPMQHGTTRRAARRQLMPRRRVLRRGVGGDTERASRRVRRAMRRENAGEHARYNGLQDEHPCNHQRGRDPLRPLPSRHRPAPRRLVHGHDIACPKGQRMHRGRVRSPLFLRAGKKMTFTMSVSPPGPDGAQGPCCEQLDAAGIE